MQTLGIRVTVVRKAVLHEDQVSSIVEVVACRRFEQACLAVAELARQVEPDDVLATIAAALGFGVEVHRAGSQGRDVDIVIIVGAAAGLVVFGLIVGLVSYLRRRRGWKEGKSGGAGSTLAAVASTSSIGLHGISSLTREPRAVGGATRVRSQTSSPRVSASDLGDEERQRRDQRRERRRERRRQSLESNLARGAESDTRRRSRGGTTNSMSPFMAPPLDMAREPRAGRRPRSRRSHSGGTAGSILQDGQARLQAIVSL